MARWRRRCSDASRLAWRIRLSACSQTRDDAPAFNQALVGKRLEVLWKYFDKDTKEPHMIWSTGTVKRVADGLTNKRSSRAKKVLPAGAVLWAWDADPDFDEAAGEQWLFLLPKKWNPTTQKQVYSWRYDPRELGATQARAGDERRRNSCVVPLRMKISMCICIIVALVGCVWGWHACIRDQQRAAVTAM